MRHRVGIGYDIHRLVEGRKLFIGAVEIPYVKGLLGHSDGDVLLHALCDAILGAAGEGDIGDLFPDTDPKYEGISSVKLLKQVLELIDKKNVEIGNVDVIIIAQEPKLVPFKKKIQKKIAELLGVYDDCVNIKAKTNDGLGETGRKEAIACFVTTIIKKEE